MPSWSDKIEAALKDEESWRQDARHAVKEYRDASKGRGFNILWPNTSIKTAAVFGRLPEPVVKRRFSAMDDISRDASIMLERALEYHWDYYPMKSILDAVVLDWMLAGRGVARLRYIPETVEKLEPVEIDEETKKFYTIGNEQVDEDDLVPDSNDVLNRRTEEILSQMVAIEHVPWENFTHDPQPRWEDVRWVAFRHDMTYKEAKESFGRNAAMKMAKVRAEYELRDAKASSQIEETFPVWEVWCKESRKVKFCSDVGHKSKKDILVELDDPYGLRGFFPTPDPLRAVPVPGSLCPVTEYSLYESQAKELNLVTSRLMRILRQINPRGGYDASIQGLAELLRTDESVLKPIENITQYVEMGGMDRAIMWVPIAEFAQSAVVLKEHRNDLLDSIYQIVGIADIMRGASDPRETRGAQELKAQFGGLRLQPAQETFANYLRSLMEMQVELMAEQFEEDTLSAMTGIEYRPEMDLILRSDVRRNFAIDIETDSTLAMDDSVKKQEMTEFVGQLGQFVGSMEQAKAIGLQPPQAAQLLKWMMGPWRVSREVEELLEQMASQPNDQSPSLEEQAKMLDAQTKSQKEQREAMKMQIDAQLKSQDLQLEAAKFAHQADMDRERLFLDALEAGASAP